MPVGVGIRVGLEGGVTYLDIAQRLVHFFVHAGQFVQTAIAGTVMMCQHLTEEKRGQRHIHYYTLATRQQAGELVLAV